MTELREVLDSMEARHIAMPISGALTCTFLDDVGLLGAAMELRQFDSCPVLEGDIPIGVFSRLGQPQTVEMGTRPLTVDQLVSADTPFMELARKLDEHNFVFVLAGSRISGFITAADLGTTPSRSFCYLKLASVEMELSKYLRWRYRPQSEALAVLPPGRRNAHGSLVAQLKEGDRYIDDIAACSLEDLLIIAGRDRPFRDALPSNRGWQKLKSGLADFRDDVMHPSRPLLTPGGRTVRKLIEKIENLQIITAAVEHLLDDREGFRVEQR